MAPDDPRLVALHEGRYHDFVPQLDTDRVPAPDGDRPSTTCSRVTADRERVLVSTHGGFISAYLAHVIGAQHVMWFNAAYTGISRVVRFPGGRVVVRSVNETSHLDES